ncbi:MAG: hypothetical protein AAGM16_10635 [Pseudomonadota bacterium]
MTLKRGMFLALILGVSLAAAGIAQQSDDSDTPETTTEGEQAAEGTDGPTEQEVLDAEDAAVDEILEDAELIYKEDEDSEDFIPSQQVSADQSLDYPIDI